MKPLRYASAVATAAVLLLGGAIVLRAVGPDYIAPGRASERVLPIAFDDYALQYYYGQLGAGFLASAGRTWGYDPNFMAGYVKTPFYYPSSKPFEVSLFVFSAFDPLRVFNATVFAMLAIAPLLLYIAAANFGLSAWERCAVVAMGIVPHLMVPASGYYAIMEAAGMVPFIFASSLAVCVVSLVYRFLDAGGRWSALGLAVGAPVLLFAHPTAALLSAVPLGVVYLSRLRSAPPRRHAWLWSVLFLALAVNWTWIDGYLRFSHYGDLGEYSTPEAIAHFAPAGGILAPLRVHVAKPYWLSLIPAVFGAVGIACWWRARRRDLLLVFVPQIAVLFVACFYGVYLGLEALAPGRLTLPLALYLFFPAAAGLASAAEGVRDATQRLGTAAGRRAATIALAAAGAGLVLVSDLPERVWRPYDLQRLESSEGLTDYAVPFMQWLREHTDDAGRILHEETDRKSHRYFGSHLAALLPLYTKRSFAGGPAPHPLVKHNVLRFVAGTFRGSPLGEVDAATLRSYLTLYNVRWVLVWKPSSKRYFRALPLTVHVSDFRGFSLFRTEIAASWFLRGAGRVSVDGDRIALSDVIPSGGGVTIKFHWLETLRTDPPRPIKPVLALDDPVPFIAIADPPPSLVIYNAYGSGEAPGVKE